MAVEVEVFPKRAYIHDLSLYGWAEYIYDGIAVAESVMLTLAVFNNDQD